MWSAWKTARVAHGSGRSVDGFQLLNAIETCADLFTRFGGHAFAVGFAMPAEKLPELKRRLRAYAEEHLAAREPERLLRIHAELPLDRITPVLAGWLRKLEPLGHGNPEPVFLARAARLLAAPRIMKARHLSLNLAHDSDRSPAAPPDASSARLPVSAAPTASIRAVGWNLAARAMDLQLEQGSSSILPTASAKTTTPTSAASKWKSSASGRRNLDAADTLNRAAILELHSPQTRRIPSCAVLKSTIWRHSSCLVPSPRRSGRRRSRHTPIRWTPLRASWAPPSSKSFATAPKRPSTRFLPAGPGRTKEFHNHILYDFQARKIYTKSSAIPPSPARS